MAWWEEEEGVTEQWRLREKKGGGQGSEDKEGACAFAGKEEATRGLLEEGTAQVGPEAAGILGTKMPWHVARVQGIV